MCSFTYVQAALMVVRRSRQNEILIVGRCRKPFNSKIHWMNFNFVRDFWWFNLHKCFEFHWFSFLTIFELRTKKYAPSSICDTRQTFVKARRVSFDWWVTILIKHFINVKEGNATSEFYSSIERQFERCCFITASNSSSDSANHFY